MPSCKFKVMHQSLLHGSSCLTVSELCKIAGVSRSGYCWEQSKSNSIPKDQADREDIEKILDSYHFRGFRKVVRGIHMRLLNINVQMILKKIR